MIILKILIITLASLILYMLFSFIINFKDIKYVLKIKDVQIKNLPIKKYIKMDAYEFKDYCENKNKLLNKDEEGLVLVNIGHLTRNFRLLYEGTRRVTFDNFFSDIFFIEISKRYFDIDSMTFNCALFYFDIDDSYNIVDLYNLYSKISKVFNKKGYYLLFITRNNRFYFESDDISPKSILLSINKKLYLHYNFKEVRISKKLLWYWARCLNLYFTCIDKI